MSDIDNDVVEIVELPNGMKMSSAFPPHWVEIQAAFNFDDDAEILVTYGDTIYNPFNQRLRPDMLVHESVHARQQGQNPEKYLVEYLANPKYRVSQEAEAYGAQVAYIRKNQGEALALRALIHFAKALSGPAYGNPCMQQEAFTFIRKASRK